MNRCFWSRLFITYDEFVQKKMSPISPKCSGQLNLIAKLIEKSWSLPASESSLNSSQAWASGTRVTTYTHRV